MSISSKFVSCQLFRQAIEISQQGQWLFEGVSEDGEASASVVWEDQRVEAKVTFLPSGELRFDEGPAGVLSLALALYVLELLSNRRQRKVYKRHLSQGPWWLNESYRVKLDFEGEDPAWEMEGIQIPLKNLREIQAYWALLDMARGGKFNTPSGYLVNQVLQRFGRERWIIQVAAMEGMLRRLQSAKSEELRLQSRPEGRQVLGFYEVRVRGGASRPYKVLLASAVGVDGSCSCRDYMKSGLGYCKHLAAVMEHWFSSPGLEQRFLKAISSWKSRIAMVAVDGGVLTPWKGFSILGDSDSQRKLKQLLVAENIREQHNDVVEHKKLWLKKVLASVRQVPSSVVVDPAVEMVLLEELHRIEWPCRHEALSKDFGKVLNALNIKLYPYQREGVERALERGRFLLADDMGLGKTVQGISWAEALLKTKQVKRVLVICPSSLKAQWAREWEVVSGRAIEMIEGTPDERLRAYQKPSSQVQVLNYELLLRDLDDISAIEVDAIVLDEAQKIKNFNTRTARSVKRLKPPFRLILTGTPMENRIQELGSLMDWIDDCVLAPHWKLDVEYRLEGDGSGHGPHGVAGLDDLRARLSHHLLRRTRREVLGDLPPRTDTALAVPFTEEQQEIHAEYALRVARLAAIAESRPLKPDEHLRLMSYLGQMRVVSNGWAQYAFNDLWPSLRHDDAPQMRLGELHSPKLVEFRDLVEGLIDQEGVKVVIFSQWQRMLRLCHWAVSDILASKGAEAVFFTGKESQRRRRENIVRFHDDENVRFFFSTDAGGVGLNLQRAATVCINLELPWNPAVLEQRNARIYRLGQTQPVQIYSLVTVGSIEERITQLVGQKKAIFDALFDGGSDSVNFDRTGSFLKNIQMAINDFKKVESKLENWDEDDESLVEMGDEVNEEPEEVSYEDEYLEQERHREHVDVNEAASLGGETCLEIDMQEELAPSGVMANVEVQSFVESEASTLSPPSSPSLRSEDVVKALQGLQVTMNAEGDVQLTAKGDSAKLLAGLFRGLAQALDP